MDLFGMGAALRCVAQVYFRAARRTGRTVALVMSCRDGDRVICLTSKEAAQLRELFRRFEKNVAVSTMSVSRWEIDRLHGDPGERNRSGHTYFDHSWLEAFYERVIDDAGEEIDHLQLILSTQQAGPAAVPVVDNRWTD